ncbi:MAG TPA: SurA N-terminal domain-containing protein [Verrucomicrobiae bacterium]|nr:SurA N-terminal domain-containing protein [Verrucomicrobiae bacterium]
MIGTIRKHSAWLWWFIVAAMAVSLLWWQAATPSRGGRSGAENFGTVYGEQITPEMYAAADHDIKLLYLFREGQWPERIASVTKMEIESQIYGRILMRAKAEQLGIYISDDDVATAADRMLSSPELAQELGFKGKTIPFQDLLKGILAPEGLGAEDFQRFVRDDLSVHQLIQVLGLSGALITPQEADALYRRERQPISAEAVFFNYSNYLSQIAAPPAAVSQFYTNHLADYRLPDRVQVSYVEFNVTNFMAAAEEKIGKTNLDYQVENAFRQIGIEGVPGATNAEQAKLAIRDNLIRRNAAAEATSRAKDFANNLFAMTPVKASNLATLAKKEGLTVKTTAPFGEQFGPEEFLAPAAFTRAAFEMSPDAPMAGPIPGPEALYVIALDKKLPSEIPAFAEIHNRVLTDFRRDEARALALTAGTNFVYKLQVALAGGNSFSAACAANGVKTEKLSPFSLSTQQIPEISDSDLLNELKRTAFTTPSGRASGLIETADGGFVLYVQSRLPVDEAQMNAAMPQFLASIRQQREQEAFNIWLNMEAAHQFPDLTRKLQGAQ